MHLSGPSQRIVFEPVELRAAEAPQHEPEPVPPLEPRREPAATSAPASR